MSSKRSKIFKQWGKVFLITLLLVFIIQTFLIQFFSVSSSSMESKINRGDKVWVDKTAYGIRLPITLLAIPFVYSKLWGFKSYIDSPTLSYHRLFAKKVGVNDIVLFNDPQDKSKPLDKRDLLISRCIAVPGDTLIVRNSEILVNGELKPLSPDIMLLYKTDKRTYFKIDSLTRADQHNTVKGDLHGDSIFMQLSRYQAYLINQKLPDKLKIFPDVSSNKLYSIILPYKNQTIDLNKKTILSFASIIMDENPKIIFNSKGLMLNDSVLNKYTFKYDYYWFLSDNPQTAIDSRTFGFVSERDVIGKVFYVSHKDMK